MAVLYCHRACQWEILLRLIPSTISGVALAWWFLSLASGYDFNTLIGWIILAMLALDILITGGFRSWFFLLVNLVKRSFAIGPGITTSQSLTLNLHYQPIILLGSVLGKQLLSYINLKLFKILIRAAVLAAAARLILG